MALKGPISKFTSLAIVDDNPNNLGSGFYPLQLTTDQINNIPVANLQIGNLVYNTTLGKICIYNGDTDDGKSGWETVESRAGVEKPAYVFISGNYNANNAEASITPSKTNVTPKTNQEDLLPISDANSTMNRARSFVYASKDSDIRYIKYIGTAKVGFTFTINMNFTKTSNDADHDYIYINFLVRRDLGSDNNDDVHNRGNLTISLLEKDNTQGISYTGFVELNPLDFIGISLSKANDNDNAIKVHVSSFNFSIIEA